MDLAHKHNCKRIISYHNFTETPDNPTLNNIINRATSMGADCIKIAVTARTPEDCSRVMALYSQHSRIIAFAMGEIGKITRIAAPLLGAPFTFAAPNETSLTAPGQLTATQMENIYREMSRCPFYSQAQKH
jgi:3-dehydroquinate dehydratase type I